MHRQSQSILARNAWIEANSWSRHWKASEIEPMTRPERSDKKSAWVRVSTPPTGWNMTSFWSIGSLRKIDSTNFHCGYPQGFLWHGKRVIFRDDEERQISYYFYMTTTEKDHSYRAYTADEIVNENVWIAWHEWNTIKTKVKTKTRYQTINWRTVSTAILTAWKYNQCNFPTGSRVRQFVLYLKPISRCCADCSAERGS